MRVNFRRNTQLKEPVKASVQRRQAVETRQDVHLGRPKTWRDAVYLKVWSAAPLAEFLIFFLLRPPLALLHIV
jgi:hypothetical protein